MQVVRHNRGEVLQFAIAAFQFGGVSLHLLFGQLLVSDVPEDGLGPDDISLGIMHGRLQHVDVQGLPPLLVPLDVVECLARLDDPPIVGLVLAGKFLGVEVHVGLALDLLQRLVQQFAERPIGKGKPPLQILAEDVHGKVFHQRRIQSLGIPQSLLGFSALADIVQKHIETVLVAKQDVSGRHLDRKFLAVTVKGREFDACVQQRAFARLEELSHSFVECLSVPDRDDHLVQRSPQRLVASPAEGRFGGRIPVHDPAIGIHADECLVGHVHDQPAVLDASPEFRRDGFQRLGALVDLLLERLVQASQVLFGTLPFRDVQGDTHDADHRPVRISKRFGVGLEDMPTPLQFEVHRFALACAAMRRNAREVLVLGSVIVVQGHPHNLVGLEIQPGQAGPGARRESKFGVRRPHDCRDLLDHQAKRCFALAKCFFRMHSLGNIP